MANTTNNNITTPAPPIPALLEEPWPFSVLIFEPAYFGFPKEIDQSDIPQN